MAAGQHNPSRRALLGAVVALPLLPRHCEERSDEAIQSGAAPRAGLLRSARNDGEGRDRARWTKALDRLRAVEAEVRAIERATAGKPAEEEEALEAVYLARLGDHSEALRRVMKVRAPDLAALALKIELAIDEEIGSLSGGELCLAALRRDVRRLMT
ncbi:MAG TPA: hypothetical protein VF620_14220 [Allosphingosinicella sp.]